LDPGGGAWTRHYDPPAGEREGMDFRVLEPFEVTAELDGTT
jgi:hypothetical protein